MVIHRMVIHHVVKRREVTTGEHRCQPVESRADAQTHFAAGIRIGDVLEWRKPRNPARNP